MTAAVHLVVAVPARNEEARIEAALASIALAIDQLRRQEPTCTATVVVAADACTDATIDLVRAAGVALVETSAGRVGAARAAAIDHALVLRPDACWIANTDADSRVPHDWLITHVAAARRGTDLLVGSIRPDEQELGAERFLHWMRRNPPSEQHGYVHGANLGIRTAAYRAVGGFPDAEVHEDVLLVDRCRADGFRIRTTDRSPVVTSARLRGRAPAGFSEYLQSLTVPSSPNPL